MSPPWACLPLIGWALIQVALARPVIRLGPAADRLTADDLAQFDKLARQKGGEAWLVLTYPPPPVSEPSLWYALVFIAPSTWHSTINTGTTLSVAATASDGPRTWRVERVAQYAQAPVSGTDPRAVTGGRDLNRPFPVWGSVDEEALKALVALIRSSPTVSPPISTTGQPVAPIFTKVNGSWPISRVVFRDAGSVEVSLAALRAATRRPCNILGSNRGRRR
jgi:hypothetical protein